MHDWREQLHDHVAVDRHMQNLTESSAIRIEQIDPLCHGV